MARPPEPIKPRDLREFRDDLKATIAARRELSPEMEDTLVTNFLQQVERTIDARVDARVDARLAEVTRGGKLHKRSSPLWVIPASLGLSIPLIGMTSAFGPAAVVPVVVMVLVICLIAFLKS